MSMNEERRLAGNPDVSSANEGRNIGTVEVLHKVSIVLHKVSIGTVNLDNARKKQVFSKL